MKKLVLLVAAAVGVAVVLKSKSEQVKAGAAKVTSDPRVQSALATATEKAAPVVSTVAEKAGPVVGGVADKLHRGSPETESLEDVPPAAVEEVTEGDPVSAPEFTGFETSTPPHGDPLTDPLPPEETKPSEG